MCLNKTRWVTVFWIFSKWGGPTPCTSNVLYEIFDSVVVFCMTRAKNLFSELTSKTPLIPHHLKETSLHVSNCMTKLKKKWHQSSFKLRTNVSVDFKEKLRASTLRKVTTTGASILWIWTGLGELQSDPSLIWRIVSTVSTSHKNVGLTKKRVLDRNFA